MLVDCAREAWCGSNRARAETQSGHREDVRIEEAYWFEVGGAAGRVRDDGAGASVGATRKRTGMPCGVDQGPCRDPHGNEGSGGSSGFGGSGDEQG